MCKARISICVVWECGVEEVVEVVGEVGVVGVRGVGEVWGVREV